MGGRRRLAQGMHECLQGAAARHVGYVCTAPRCFECTCPPLTSHPLCTHIFPCKLQVDTTKGFYVGQWVRIYALARSPARRRLLQSAAATNSTSALPRLVSSAAASQGNGTLPLTPALQKLMVEAQRYAAAEQQGVSAAAQPGTLDAYLYGENLVDSGKSERGAVPAEGAARLLACIAAPPACLHACLRAPLGLNPTLHTLRCCLGILGSNTCRARPPPPAAPADAFAGTDHIRFPSRITAVGPGWIQLQRPLPYDVRTQWQVGGAGRRLQLRSQAECAGGQAKCCLSPSL